MDAVFIKIINMSWMAVWLILAIIVFRLVFKRAPKWIVCILWGLVALRLMLPFSFESSLSLQPASTPISEEIVMEVAPSVDSGIGVLDEAVNEILSENSVPSPGASVNPLQIWLFVGEVIWLAGIILLLCYAVGSFLILKFKVRASIEIEKNIRVCDHILSPFILGILRPIIYLPSDIGDVQREHVLLHERAHIKRKDHWWKPLGFVLLAVHWFNPAVWIGYILLCRDIEFACDESVVRKMGLDSVVGYSESLLSCSISRKSTAMCPLAFGEVGVKKRIKNVLSFKKPAVWLVTVAVLIGTILGVTLLTNRNPQNDMYDLLVVKGEAGAICSYYNTDKNDIYFYGVSEVKVLLDNGYIDLKDALKQDEYLVEKIIERAKREAKVEIKEESGTVLYRYDDFALLDLDLKVSMLGSTQDQPIDSDYRYNGGIYFGSSDMTIELIEMLWANRKIPGRQNVGIAINLGKKGTNLRFLTYGGKDASGQNGADVIEKYYKLYYMEKSMAYSGLYSNDYAEKHKNSLNPDVTLLELSHCQVVDSTMLTASDYERFEEICEDYIACCYVQTADKIRCNEDSALGSSGEEIARQYVYFLVREDNDSDWKIYDFGNPPFYVSTKKATEYDLNVHLNHQMTLMKLTDEKLREQIGFDVYYCGLDSAQVYLDGKFVDFEKAIKANPKIVNDFVEFAKRGVEQGNGDYYKDGGSMVYFADSYTVIKKHSMMPDDVNRYDETLYIGPIGMGLNEIKNYK